MGTQSLGTLLLQHGWITREQLGLAISKQREIGGRLGSCLLEMGAITEGLLDRVLTEQQGVPTATAEDLSDIPDDLIELLPAKIAIRYQAVPFGSSAEHVDVAMLEVENLWLQDELSFIVGQRLKVHIANEARLLAALARYYGAPLTERFTKLERFLDQHRRPPAADTPGVHPESRLVHADLFADEPPRVVSIRTSEIDVNDERSADTATQKASADHHLRSIPLSAEELTELGTEAAQEPAGDKVFPFLHARDQDSDGVVEIVDVEGRLAAALHPDEIGQILVDYLAQFFVRVLVFQVRQGAVVGWLGHGPGLDQERFARYQVSFSEPSIFLNLREGGSFFIGKLPDMPPHVEMAACWSKDLADECAVFPVRIRDHLVSLIYGDRGPLGLQALDLELIRRLLCLASEAFKNCILHQKQDRLRQAQDR